MRLSSCASAVFITLLVTSNVVAQDSDSQPRAEIKMIVGAFFRGSDFVTGAPVTFDNSSTTLSASAGAGLKMFISKHIFVAPEARLGWQPTARATVSIGYVFPVQD
ncbi:MAG TPA: hypothetical protein VIT88_02005 [Pyrinomonadaceae bacterium]